MRNCTVHCMTKNCPAPEQAPGKDSPDVSFKVGPQDSPVAVTLGQQPGLDGGADKVRSSLYVRIIFWTEARSSNRKRSSVWQEG